MRHVLAIDGGGTRALLPAIFLEKLEADFRSPLSSIFSLITGASTSGMVALTAAMGMPMSGCVDLLEKRVDRLYVERRTDKHLAKYSADGLRAECFAYFGSPDREVTLGDAATRVMLPVFNIKDNRLDILRSWENSDTTVDDAAVFSMATPGLYASPSAYCDGGIMAPDPSLLAYMEARRLWPGEPIRLLSLGVGRFVKGQYEWLDAQMVFGADASNLIPNAMRTLLEGDDYVRVNPEIQGAMPWKLDERDPVCLSTLRQAAEMAFAEFQAREAAATTPA